MPAFRLHFRREMFAPPTALQKFLFSFLFFLGLVCDCSSPSVNLPFSVPLHSDTELQLFTSFVSTSIGNRKVYNLKGFPLVFKLSVHIYARTKEDFHFIRVAITVKTIGVVIVPL